MLYLTRKPQPPLSDFVELFWYYEGYTQPHAKERIMPDASMQVIINLQQDEARIYHPQNPQNFDRYPGTILCGPRSRFEVIDTAGQAWVMGIQFLPGGAAPFLALPLTEVQDRVVPLECLWGLAGRDVRNRVLEASTPEQRLQVFEQCLLEQTIAPLERSLAVRGALHYIERKLPAVQVGDLASTLGISRRRFIQVFSDEIGLTPKLFCRVRRFQQVLRALHVERDMDWSDLALSCGYFDQAHFNHDFRAFSGMTPTHYLKCRTPHVNHVPLMD